MNNLSQFDKQCLEKAIENARSTFADGNYPVGAVLAVDNEIIDSAGNKINKQKSFVNHVENELIIEIPIIKTSKYKPMFL